jgi:AcrR family transcriptional regulator
LRVNPEKKEEKERVAHALLRATLRLAAAHGFTSLGLREVARAAEIAPTSFYRHFADMEELGLALIDDLGGRFIDGWIARVKPGSGDAGTPLESIVSHALAAALEDPELMRFILAERAGALPPFRAALSQKVSLLKGALQVAIASEHATAEAGVSTYVSDAAVVLLLEACGQLLEQPEQSTLLRARLLRQIRALFSGAASTGGNT